MHKAHLTIGLLALGAMAACGQTDTERGVSGALLGAGAAAATDNDPLVGAALGGTAGVFADDVGALTPSR